MTLIMVILGASFLLLGLWPRRGFLWKLRRGLRKTTRVLIEDALKHLYGEEYREQTCTLQSISGKLEISGDRAAELMARLGSLGLVVVRGDGFELTAEGRAYALKMIRIHRLWERYLADKTGLDETEWHARAEKLEHHTTEQKIDALVAKVGDARYDPHGDPIPTATGKLPPKKGHPMSELDEGVVARIIHLEDEPAMIFAQLVAQRLHPGMQVQIVEKSPTRIEFLADGEENVLAPIVAVNITVEPVAELEPLEAPPETLSVLKPGEMGEVLGISLACRGQQRRRLMDLGIIPGTVILTEMTSVSGDPVAYNIRGATIALRRQQADTVHIKRLKEGNGNGHS